MVMKEFKELPLSTFLRDWIIGISLSSTEVGKPIREWQPPIMVILS